MSQTVDFGPCLARSKCESISPLDDLAFDMYQDPEVAHMIRLLDQKKQDMVRQGKNEQSKTLKQAIADLQKVSLLAGGNRMIYKKISQPKKTQFFSFSHMVELLAPQTPQFAEHLRALQAILRSQELFEMKLTRFKGLTAYS